MTKRAVLIGAGHSHLLVIRKARRFVEAGHELVVVAPEPFWYSGLATGMLGGMYSPDLDRIDVAGLAERAGARFIADRMIGLERATRRVILEKSAPLGYDVLSLNVGSAPPKIPGADCPGCYGVKPIAGLVTLRGDLQSRFAAGGAAVRVVIAGAGATGAELAGNISRLAEAAGAPVDVAVLAAGREVLRQLPGRAAASVRASLEWRGVRFVVDSRVIGLRSGRADLAGGGSVEFDVFINAAGLTPPPILRALGLPLDAAGALLVDRHLRSPADPLIHGGGDCAALEGHALPRIGVYAIRQAPILLHNLLAAPEGAMPRTFRPQRRYLWIMNLGDGAGLAVRGGLWWRGRAAFRLKDWIDRRFLRLNRAP